MDEIKDIEKQISIKLMEIEASKNQLEILKLQKLELEYPIMSWDDLEKWLKENRPENNYRDNPKIRSLDGNHFYYCFITDGGELQVGPYYNTDHFPRGEDVRVHYDFKPWKSDLIF